MSQDFSFSNVLSQQFVKAIEEKNITLFESIASIAKSYIFDTVPVENIAPAENTVLISVDLKALTANKTNYRQCPSGSGICKEEIANWVCKFLKDSPDQSSNYYEMISQFEKNFEKRFTSQDLKVKAIMDNKTMKTRDVTRWKCRFSDILYQMRRQKLIEALPGKSRYKLSS